jgi:hypothetical protein
MGAVLQSQAASPGDWGTMSCGSVFRDPGGIKEDDGARDRGECLGDGTAGETARAILHGGSDGRAVGGLTGGEGKIAFDGR